MKPSRFFLHQPCVADCDRGRSLERSSTAFDWPNEMETLDMENVSSFFWYSDIFCHVVVDFLICLGI